MRVFQTLVVAAAVILALAGPAFAATDLTDTETYSFAQQLMLMLINQERTKANLGRVRLDPLACQGAKNHAEDMLDGGFFSHWNRAGLKPTRRFNLLGGFHTLGENIYYTHRSPDSLEAHLERMIATLMDSPGHRKTILDPKYTHVGLGFALDEGEQDFYGVQDFVAYLGGAYSCPVTALLGERVVFQGRFDPNRYEMEHVIAGYEEKPQPRDRLWLMKTEEYGDAKKMVAGYTPDPHSRFGSVATYHDIEINQDEGWFICRALMDYKGKEGLYYLFAWFLDRQTGGSVLAAVATVEVTK